MRQWREIKSKHRDALVFFRVGDFYEMFGDDAEEGSRLLGLTLTSRNNGAAGRVPLAGVPVKALDEYLARLVKLGRRVAICEQMEEATSSKKIVPRKVVETVTPGTVLSGQLLEAKRNNYVAALAVAVAPGAGATGPTGTATPPRATGPTGAARATGPTGAAGAAGAGDSLGDPSLPVGVAAVDVSTGETTVVAAVLGELEEALARFEPREILVSESGQALLSPAGHGWAASGDDGRGATGTTSGSAGGPRAATGGPSAAGVVTVRPDWTFEEETARDELVRRYRVQSLDGFGFEPGDGLLVRAAGALVAYVTEIRPGASDHLLAPRVLRPGSFMTLDSMTRRNLELVEPLRPGEGDASLLSVLDATRTPMGARLLRSWLLAPLVDADAIRRRQGGVAELVDDDSTRAALRVALARVRDLDRLATRIGAGRGSPRDVLALGVSAREIPGLAEAGQELGSPALRSLFDGLDALEDVEALVAEAISDDAPATLAEGGVIREGFNRELDELREVRDGAQEFIAGLQTRERENTGIASLRVGFNKPFGYYLEVTKPNLPRVPQHFIRKQTLTGAERFFTPELKEWEEKVFGAEERIAQVEESLFRRLRQELVGAVPRMQRTSRRLAELDVTAALAEVAEAQGYARPEISTGFAFDATAGRHPVVETMMPREDFIPNDLLLDEEGRIAILTGPNMAGKSTVLRQAGLLQIMAQMGSYVPAERARLAVCDRVFTRVGASDSLARGQSTFMVEMNETASIIHGATERSLVLLDEIGRGTSTYDGVSIAWAVTEHIHERVGAKTVFATHYHELTQLGDLLPCVKNLNVAVRESGDDIVFLRRLEEGGADRSYGIQVARLAGFPPELLARARGLLAELEGTHSSGGKGLGRGRDAPKTPADDQITLFDVEHPVLDRLRSLDPDRMTPLEALAALHALREMAE